jgi:hypothetical protein
MWYLPSVNKKRYLVVDWAIEVTGRSRVVLDLRNRLESLHELLQAPVPHKYIVMSLSSIRSDI